MGKFRVFLYWSDRYIALWALGCGGGVAGAAWNTYYLGSPPSQTVCLLCVASAAISLVRVLKEWQSSLGATGAIARASFERQRTPWNVILLMASLSAVPMIDHVVSDRTTRKPPVPPANRVPRYFLGEVPAVEERQSAYKDVSQTPQPSKSAGSEKLASILSTKTPIEVETEVSSASLLPLDTIGASSSSTVLAEEPAHERESGTNGSNSDGARTEREQIFHPLNRPEIHTGYYTVFPAQTDAGH
jgi:hypothetical protein